MPGAGLKEMAWVEPSGQERPEEAGQAGYVCGLGGRMAGALMDDEEERGASVGGDTVLRLWHAAQAALPVMLPATREGPPWERVLDTADPQGKPIPCTGGQQDELQGGALVVLWTSSAAGGGRAMPGTCRCGALRPRHQSRQAADARQRHRPARGRGARAVPGPCRGRRPMRSRRPASYAMPR